MSFNRKIIIGFILFVLSGCCLIFIYFYKARPQIASVCDLSHVQTGDLILSAGESFKSIIVKKFEDSKDALLINRDSNDNIYYVGYYDKNGEYHIFDEYVTD